MTMRPRALLTIVGVAVALACGAGAASAASYLHLGTTTGNLLAPGTPIMPASTGYATLSISVLGIHGCGPGSGFVTVGASGGATIAATGGGLTFTACSTPISGMTFTGCHLVPPLPTATITATSSTGGAVTFTDTYMRCDVTNTPFGCYLTAATATGIITNAGATLAYTNVPVQHSVPLGGTGDLGAACGTTGLFSASFTDLTAGSPSSTLVLNQTA